VNDSAVRLPWPIELASQRLFTARREFQHRREPRLTSVASKPPENTIASQNLHGRSSGWKGAPALTLLVLSPVIGEVLFGATRLTTIFVLIPQVGSAY
jgi:hypothetical protein